MNPSFVNSCRSKVKNYCHHKEGDVLAIIATVFNIALVWLSYSRNIDLPVMNIIQTTANVLLLRLAFWPTVYKAGSIYIILISLHGLYYLSIEM